MRKLGRPFDEQAAAAAADRILGIMDSHLAQRNWLATNEATIADIACFPYIALAYEADLSIKDYPAITRWCERVAALPGFAWLPADFYAVYVGFRCAYVRPALVPK
ncbi:glutathione binding-like protein [Chelativorans sp. M5D2P16]|uniref:glutathione binding-like protein n=1 Tax=Chelativorans sp. M5D2P16 TaxID=3095678 RepID=UPI002ACA9C9B|nr:glutathione binding-like protein [Chelativorans sp. M5D2P16]MDZ5697469.1 glutathione binding-like protein [Chelativorans sp. M5D2P16]